MAARSNNQHPCLWDLLDQLKRIDKSNIWSSREDNHNPADSDNDDDDSDDQMQHVININIPSVVRKHGRSLASADRDVLKQSLQPVLDSLEKLDAEKLLNLERVPNGARLHDGVNVRPIHDLVYPQYENTGEVSCVRYVHIAEVEDQYSIGIFVFPPFARIPLHDHPGMCVLSRVLYGDLQNLSLDLPDEQEQLQRLHGQSRQQAPGQATAGASVFHSPYQAFCNAAHHVLHPGSSNSSSSAVHMMDLDIPPGLPKGTRRAFKNHVSHFHAPDVSMLFPYKGNLHEFYAGPNGAAVLDILLPPYDADHDRDCTFYDVHEDPRPTIQPGDMMLDVDPASHSHLVMRSDPRRRSQSTTNGPMAGAHEQDDDERSPCWIVPTCQPSDFHCLSGVYHQLSGSVVHTQDS